LLFGWQKKYCAVTGLPIQIGGKFLNEVETLDSNKDILPPETDPEKILLVPAIGDRWSCGPKTVLVRLRLFGAPILKFNQRVCGVKLRDVLRIEEEVSS
jgi:hypothetical protein